MGFELEAETSGLGLKRSAIWIRGLRCIWRGIGMSAIFHLIIIHVSTTDAKASFAWLVDYFYPSVLVISGYRGDDVDVETGSGLREKIMCRLYRLWRCRGRGGRGFPFRDQKAGRLERHPGRRVGGTQGGR